VIALHRDLIALSSTAPFVGVTRERLQGAVLDERAFLLRFIGEHGENALLLVNLGTEMSLTPQPEPLLAPPQGAAWRVRWMSESSEYGGRGAPPVPMDPALHLPAHCAIVLEPEYV
jgi:maltooligosyltrehalose trehalohydrolase